MNGIYWNKNIKNIKLSVQSVTLISNNKIWIKFLIDYRYLSKNVITFERP